MQQLIQSNLAGIANLEAATGEPFAETFRQWTTTLLMSGGVKPPGPEATEDSYPPLARLLCGPRLLPLPLTAGRWEGDLAGTSAAYFLLHKPTGKAARLTIHADPTAELQVTLLRVPENAARLSLTVRSEVNGNVRLVLTAHDNDVTPEAAAWERLVPVSSRAVDTSYRPDAPTAEVGAWFGDRRLKTGETRISPAIALPREGGPVLFKVVGTDALGHAVTAWAQVP